MVTNNPSQHGEIDRSIKTENVAIKIVTVCKVKSHPHPRINQFAKTAPFAWQPGVTLFELMTAVCIISLMASLGLVSVKPLWQKHMLRTSVSELESRIQFLRMKAILENQTVEMNIKDGHLLYRKKTRTSWEGWKRYRLNPSAHYLFSGSIYFDRHGFSSPRTISVRLGVYRQNLIININGRVRVSEIT